MKVFVLFAAFLLLGAVLLGAVFTRLEGREVFSALLSVTAPMGAAVFLLTFAGWFFASVRWRRVLVSMGYEIPPLRLFPTYLAGFSITFFAPMLILGGEVFRAYVLTDRHEVPFPSAFASTLIDKLLEMTVILILVIFGVTFFLSHTAVLSPLLGGVLLLLVVSFASLLVFFYLKSFGSRSIVRRLASGREPADLLELERRVFGFVNLKNPAFWEGVGWSVLRAASLVLRAWLLVVFLGGNLSALSVFSVAAFTQLALLVPVPASLGIHDGIQAAAFEALGLGAFMGAAFALVVRAAEVVLALVGLLLLVPIGFLVLRLALLRRLGRLLSL